MKIVDRNDLKTTICWMGKYRPNGDYVIGFSGTGEVLFQYTHIPPEGHPIAEDDFVGNPHYEGDLERMIRAAVQNFNNEFEKCMISPRDHVKLVTNQTVTLATLQNIFDLTAMMVRSAIEKPPSVHWW